MFTAFGPRGSAWTSKLTFWPSTSGGIPERSTAEIWTKTSLEPSSGAMKPKPLVVLKNFTVPVIMCESSRSEEHTSELQSLMRISYAVFCLKKNTTHHLREY